MQRDKGDNRAKGVGGGVRQEGGENVQSTEEWEGQRERQRGEGEVKDRGREHEEEGERGGGRERPSYDRWFPTNQLCLQ